ncbi:MAG: bifunctional adenosylcobinamide kinase/adenosylcobinamide-phosphate guanylyltransferase [Rikenellaceae bacterium]
MAKIVYVTGGQRSGKSSFAQQMVENLSENPLYLATARCWDSEFEKRIERHKADRGEKWTNVEKEKNLSELNLEGRVVLMDCVTLWITNIYCDNNFDAEKSLKEAKADWAEFIKQDFTLVVVSNEIGMGVIPADSSTRAFVDMQGWLNQYIASTADEVYAMFSGISVKIK